MSTVDNTFGAFLIGVVVSATLYGVTCMQTWYYFSRYISDPWYNKFCVGAIFLSDSTHQALITHTVYTYLIIDVDNATDLEKIVWSLAVEVVFNGFTALVVQSFLTIRVYRLSNKNIFATASVLSLVIAEFILDIIYFSKAIHLTFLTQVPQLKPWAMSMNAVAAAGDVLISAFLCTFLERSRTGSRRSDTMINKLMLFSVSTGLLTSVCAVMSLISIIVWPNTFIYVAFYFCLGRLYCNSLLATLNARKGIRRIPCNEPMSLSLHAVRRHINSPISSSRMGMPNDLSIKMDTAQEYIENDFLSTKDLKRPQSV
ncbi:uncharacterized protein EDB93DRAFT_1245557 [Suillus bovinus]|uniref:uncharacterized protein n=1 Tax=Suillus bovinus TaxID=48563 RepID=UPI001B874A17|nr:uncharacterized protein EDB93DRAFT_1245557 [Suillus bovinus]KAG2158996.1 hypothetical protein EDB93DRAFT_1245557 [Suillus bovinus]